MYHETTKVLIVVKTYPTPARKGIEVSCTAGVTEDGRFIRIFPLPFRFLAGEKKFSKYQWLNISITKASDPRPDSYTVDLDSIEVLDKPLSTSNDWQARKDIIMPLLSPSLCHLERMRSENGTTLGLFKPAKIEGFIIEPEKQPEWTAKESEILSQESMFDSKPLKILEKIPYKFYYQFKCNEPGCNGHCLSVVDWEIGESYRSWKARYGAGWENKFRQKFETEMIQKYDTHFYVGTMRAHPASWIIIGLFYPPKS